MKSSVTSHIYDYLVQKCENIGISLNDVAKNAKVSHQVLSSWKKKDPHTLETIHALLMEIDSQIDNKRRGYEKSNDLFANGFIRAYSGTYVNVFYPNPLMFLIGDIAEGLSCKLRWGGHSASKITVAEHSLKVARHVMAWCLRNKLSWELTRQIVLQALLHDGSEAYISDIPSPIKAGLPEYKVIEEKVMSCIAERFGFNWPMHEAVKQADHYELNREWHNLVLKPGRVMTASRAKKGFLAYFEMLTAA